MEHTIKKTLSEFALEIEKDVQLQGFSEQALINKWTGKLFSLSNEFRNTSVKLSFKELYNETVSAVSKKKEGNALFDSIPTGLVDLDRITGGLPMGELIILGGRPAMGKTGLLLSIIANSIKNKNAPIAYFSMENSAQSIMLRLLSLFSELSHHSIVTRPLEAHEISLMMESTTKLADADLTIEDNCFTIDDIISQTCYLVKEKGVKLIIVDYLQLVQAKGKMHREQEVAKVCRELKGLARQFNIAVLVASQLSRAVETRGGDKRPQLSDLRESGSIEQDADKVLFIHRPEYYNITEDENGASTMGIAEIIVAKNRSGFVDSAKVKYTGYISTFTDLEMLPSLKPNYGTEYFKEIRKDEFKQTIDQVVRGSKMNDIDEDYPF